MKKMFMVILSLVLILSLSACGGSGETEGSDKEEAAETKVEENLTAYEYYNKAITNYEDADSYDIDMESKIDITAISLDMDMKMGGNIQMSGVNVEEKVLVMDIYNDVYGQESLIKGFYKDGYTYAEEDGEKSKTKTDFKEIDDTLHIHPIKFSNDLVEDQSVKETAGGMELHMKLKDEAVNQITFGMFGNITSLIDESFGSLDGEINLKAVSLVATVTSELQFTDLILTAAYDAAGDGEAGTINVTSTEKFNKIGGVKFDIPTDLSAYKEK